jgi:serine/threonine protein kinase
LFWFIVCILNLQKDNVVKKMDVAQLQPIVLSNYTRKEIGKGASSTVYALTPIGELTPTLIVKVLVRDAKTEPQVFIDSVRAEYLVSQYLQDIGERQLCQDRASCALWVRLASDKCLIAFPYTNAITLYTFLESFVADPELRASTLGKVTLLYIAKEILAALALMHKIGIVHSDVKLDNIVLERSEGSLYVDNISRVRIIDFGLACSESARVQIYLNNIRSGEADQFLLDCNPTGKNGVSYLTTSLYQDPLSMELGKPKVFQDRALAQKAFVKFDLYAAACLIQYLFDAEQYVERIKYKLYYNIDIEQTDFMPAWKVRATSRASSQSSEGSEEYELVKEESSTDSEDRAADPLLSILKEMSGPLEQRRTAAEYAVAFEDMYVAFVSQNQSKLN